MAQEYVYFSDKELELAQEYWPGALTLVLNAMPGKVADIALRDGAIGVRVPGDRAARELIEAIGVPLIGTSANIAGGDNLLTSQEIEAQLRVQVLDTGCIPNGSCSTIVRVQEGGVLNVLRQGAVIVQPL
jgi:L-threonylcarbamoyladenylate synthase